MRPTFYFAEKYACVEYDPRFKSDWKERVARFASPWNHQIHKHLLPPDKQQSKQCQSLYNLNFYSLAKFNKSVALFLLNT